MVAMLQRLNARSFFFGAEPSVGSFFALFLKVFRDRLMASSVADRSRAICPILATRRQFMHCALE